jgi:hypothetical protein
VSYQTSKSGNFNVLNYSGTSSPTAQPHLQEIPNCGVRINLGFRIKESTDLSILSTLLTVNLKVRFLQTLPWHPVEASRTSQATTPD